MLLSPFLDPPPGALREISCREPRWVLEVLERSIAVLVGRIEINIFDWVQFCCQIYFRMTLFLTLSNVGILVFLLLPLGSERRKKRQERNREMLFFSLVSIGGRGVGIWEGDQLNFGRGGCWFLDPPSGGEQVLPFWGGKGGAIKDKTGKFFFIAAERQQNFGNFEQK